MNEFLSTKNTHFHLLPKTTQQIILLYTKGTSNKIFNQRHSLTDPYTGQPVPTIDIDGTQIYYKFGQKRRDGDRPAIIRSDGILEYYKNDKLHRDNDLPAVIHKDNTLVYYQNGYRHRDNDLPAIIHSGGTLVYYKNGHQYTPNIE